MVIALANDSIVILVLREMMFPSDVIIYNVTNIIMVFIHPTHAGFFQPMGNVIGTIGTLGNIPNAPTPCTSRNGKSLRSSKTHSEFYVGNNNMKGCKGKNGT